MKKTRFLSLMLAFVTVLTVFAGCSDGETIKDGTRAVTDHNGNIVNVPETIERIVVCDIYPLPSFITVFFDSAEKIVGIAPASMAAAKNGLLGKMYPEILNAKTDFFNGSDVNLEELLKLDPDVVFYSASNPTLGKQLTGAGIAAVAVSPSRWGYDGEATLNNWIALLSHMFPDNDKSEAVRKYTAEVIEQVTSRTKNIADEDKKSAFFLFQYSESNMLTATSHSFGQWWADTVGVKNASAELDGDNYSPVGMEQVYAWDPDMIFMTNFTTSVPDDLYNNTVGTYDWSGISAVRNGKVYKMPLGMYRSYTTGVDMPITLLWLAKTAYPELFEDIDITEETVKYYREIFGIELTDEEAGMIFTPASDAGDVDVR